ncbi:hypothetical protein EXIGLDRAFT_208470 [Exidia glandulosa HHB12029]|uniref:CS domain-containing protein n=1 Tax=Exidia glandulosa HHB12029 TaxID=1314781 RepID=A0A165EL22_EXIGL|nr:hypothetical protein EXIGLDRAFT_208470 [Exidia glandulosa HHB12029]
MTRHAPRGCASESWRMLTTHSQATVLLHVPYDTTEDDVLVAIEQNSLVARVRGQPPIVKGRLYAAVDATNSMWQLERAGARPARARTISTASSRSSYALVSDPEQTDVFSSCAVSVERDADSEPDSELSASSPALSSPSHGSGSGSGGSSGRGGHQGHISLPQIESLSSSFSSVDSLHNQTSVRLLTLHLEKTEPAIWPALIAGPAPVALVPPVQAPPGAEASGEAAYNADPMSLALLGVEHLDVRKDRDTAFERSWLQARTPLATLKLVTQFLPVHTSLPPPDAPAPRGSIAYQVQALGGPPALAKLYLEAGMTLQLEGTGAMHHGAGALSSIRTSGPTTAYADARRRDREAAKRYFDRARALDPRADVPSLASDTDDEDTVLGLRMPELPIGSAAGSAASSVPRPRPRRRRDREKEKAAARRDKEETGSLCSQKGAPGDVDGTWYLWLPGMLGAGTALLAVAVIGAVSVSSWRKSQS